MNVQILKHVAQELVVRILKEVIRAIARKDSKALTLEQQAVLMSMNVVDLHVLEMKNA